MKDIFNLTWDSTKYWEENLRPECHHAHKILPAQRNTVLARSSSNPCRSCHHNSSNTRSALHRTLHSLCKCPSCPTLGKELPAWSILIAGIAAEIQKSEHVFTLFRFINCGTLLSCHTERVKVKSCNSFSVLHFVDIPDTDLHELR